jgi:hypothetical protein
VEDYTLLCHVGVISGGLFRQPDVIECAKEMGISSLKASQTDLV